MIDFNWCLENNSGMKQAFGRTDESFESCDCPSIDIPRALDVMSRHHYLPCPAIGYSFPRCTGNQPALIDKPACLEGW